jgi:hypothetical protein
MLFYIGASPLLIAKSIIAIMISRTAKLRACACKTKKNQILSSSRNFRKLFTTRATGASG